MRNITCILLLLLSIVSCSKNDNEIQQTPTESMYYPSNTSASWETKSLSSLGWNQNAVQPLKDYLNQKGTKSFMILVNGRIVMEEYFNGHTATATWEWNSAGKTLVASTVGIAQQENLLNINNKVSDYLGTEWTSMPLNKENLITVKHLLTMTAGNDDTKQYVIKSNLTYIADAGTRWAYSNIFQKLTDVVNKASNKPFETYFNEKLKSKIGMEGFWNFGTIFTIYHSNTKSMARFGLLALNKGKWNNEQIINESYFNESVSTSQSINPSYGYLWWLNGKTSFMIPNEQNVYQGFLVPNAPADMYAAMGAKDQRIYVIPSKKMAVIRMGDASDPVNPNFAVSGFDNELWGKINAVIN
ncbi:MAG: serine hydrolase [Flavobacterium sp.]|uniref:serine hydrolase domain-containing protein n=1 Tax=Flavobacterium sp. TaxID=239 RepID=UPI001B4F702E|nr:serine hydrolase [Flavobacterium sp.]MBP6146275.1 serine hydrolase [Flavobacterium sp.]MBP7182127.1 serine hydrolase [Flavobacterium sp.]MBP7318233.1 serine hydrolase [Flavobacterium sp.]MBP8887852.1 serine hydrolase [Flavobacterium sp.]